MKEKRARKGLRKALVAGGIVLAVLLVLMAIGLGCGGGQKPRKSDQGLKEVSKGEVDLMRVESGGEAPEQQGTPIAGTRTPVSQVPKTETKNIRTGSLTIEIKKDTFNRSYSRVVLMAESVGGLVSDSRSDSSAGRVTGGTVTVRVPNDSFSKVMDELKKMGKVTAISEQAQDVTEEYVDLESRINNLRTQEAVYLRLMAKAQTIDESIAVQRELSVIQEQIEQLLGRKNYLDNHVQFSTVQVTLLEPGAAVSEDGGWGFVRALSDAAHGIINGINTVIRFLGDALIYILIVAALAALAFVIFRKHSGEKKA
ncbi:MAG: DUF4349 domain-containing protein [Actinobacteria bacterium]|nr:DUF4349 domain-containing protein [Actinomycetota bacterium]